MNQITRFAHSARLRHHTRQLRKTLPLVQFAQLHQRYIARNKTVPQEEKYFDHEFQIDRNVSYAIQLGLHRKPPQVILDVGSGMGWFALACRHFGHRVVGIDMPNQLYSEAFQLWQIERLEHTIEKFQPLPVLPTGIDFVSAISICFNGHKSSQLWGIREWEYWVENLAQSMSPKGRFFLRFNREPDGTHFSEDLSGYFEALGGRKAYASYRFPRP